MMLKDAIVLLTFVFICLYFRRKKLKKVPKPPGPFQIPIVGNWLEFRRSPLETFVKWHKKYGQIVGLKICSYNVILISDAEILKEAFQNVNFFARAQTIPMILFSGGHDRGTVTSTEFRNWEAVRNLEIKVLSEIGFAPRPGDDLMLQDIGSMVDRWKRDLQNGNSEMCLRDAVMVPVTRYVWHMMSGQNLDLESSVNLQVQLLDFQNKFFLPIGNLLFWMDPKFIEFLTTINAYKGVKTAAESLHKLIQITVHKTKHEIDRDECDLQGHSTCSTSISKNFMKTWLLKSQQRRKSLPSLSCLYEEAGENNLKGTVANIFMTGVIAFVNLLNWAFAFAACRPDVQQKLRDEIQEVIGSCTIDIRDMDRMPYTMAFMKEVLRVSSGAPFANFHQAISDTVFRGFQIPTGTILIGNLYGANHDPKIWGDPERFRPERFLAQDEKSVPQSVHFSVGLRTCVGQTYTRNAFFLYFVSILQNFKLTFAPSLGEISEADIKNEALVSIWRFAKPYAFKLQSIE